VILLTQIGGKASYENTQGEVEASSLRYEGVHLMPLPKDYRRIENSTRHIAAGAKRVGPADPNEVISVTIAVRRRPGAPALPSQEHWAATPVGERRYITTEEFAAQYGAAPDDLDLVADFAVRHGLNVAERDAAQRIVIVSGTVAQISEAFGVELGHYEIEHAPDAQHPRGDGNRRPPRRPVRESYRGYEGELHLPADVAPVVEGVFGLDNRRMAQRAVTPLPMITPLTPPQVAELYHFPKPPHHIDRETIGLFEFSDPVIGTCGYLASDIQAYFTTAQGIGPGFVTPTITNIGVNGAANSPGSGSVFNADAEVTLDISVSAAVAQGANIAVYFTTWDENGWILALKRAIHPHHGEPRPSVLSISWGWAEFDSLGNLAWTAAAMAAVNAAFQEAAMFGMTVLIASGDDGSNCQVGDGLAHVYYPQSDPWVITCGGTTIGNVSGLSFTEVTWTDNGITGGGISDFFDLPHWQRHHDVPLSVNPGHRRGRGVPDIAGYANGYEIVLQGAASPGWWGTSETAPLYAGLIAIVNARLHERVGYLNPILYSQFAADVFRDIADGRSNATGGAPGYVSVPGWDACTGLGSIKGDALLRLLHREEELREEEHITGKVAGLVFDHFGDFEGFLLEDLHGREHRFESHEEEVRELVHRALMDRNMTTVRTDHHHSHRPVSIVLRGT
jgi:kumamolisin